MPEAMLMDRGGVVGHQKRVWTDVAVGAVDRARDSIALRASGHPQAQGKVERFHRTLDEALRYHGKPSQLAQWPGRWKNFGLSITSKDLTSPGVEKTVERYRAGERGTRRSRSSGNILGRGVVRELNAKGVLDMGRAAMVRV